MGRRMTSGHGASAVENRKNALRMVNMNEHIEQTPAGAQVCCASVQVEWPGGDICSPLFSDSFISKTHSKIAVSQSR